MAIYTVAQFASKDAAMRRKCRKLNNHIRYCRDPVEHDIVAKLCMVISSILDHCFDRFGGDI